MQSALNERYLDGVDPDTLEAQTWEQFCSCLGSPQTAGSDLSRPLCLGPPEIRNDIAVRFSA